MEQTRTDEIYCPRLDCDYLYHPIKFFVRSFSIQRAKVPYFKSSKPFLVVLPIRANYSYIYYLNCLRRLFRNIDMES